MKLVSRACRYASSSDKHGNENRLLSLNSLEVEQHRPFGIEIEPSPDIWSDSMSNPRASHLKDRIAAKSAAIGIVGLGYVGLPLAQALLRKGFPVIGVDVDPAKV